MVWKQFLEKMPDDCNTLAIKTFVKISHHVRDKSAFAFYAEIQNGHQMAENQFLDKTAGGLWVPRG